MMSELPFPARNLKVKSSATEGLLAPRYLQKRIGGERDLNGYPIAISIFCNLVYTIYKRGERSGMASSPWNVLGLNETDILSRSELISKI